MEPTVAAWFARRSSRADDWPLDLLRGRQGRAPTVSVVLPALDEEATVGEIVDADPPRPHATCRARSSTSSSSLDSGSTDRTAAVAAAAGATRRPPRRRPARACPSVPGKGEALWRSLAGDHRRHRRLRRRRPAGVPRPTSSPGCSVRCSPTPSVALRQGDVRPAADRRRGRAPRPGRTRHRAGRAAAAEPALAAAGRLRPAAGRRVRRPPLLLERLPFATGYGVELAPADRRAATPSASTRMAQVDLGERRHRHHDDLRARPDGRRDLADRAGPAAPGRRPAGRTSRR